MTRHDPENEHVNDVHLVGVVSGEVQVRQLPSGDCVHEFRLVVRRPATHASRQSVDTVDCAVWRAGLRRRSMGLLPGDTVEVTGALRRRFFATGAGRGSRVSIEVSRLRRLRRAASA